MKGFVYIVFIIAYVLVTFFGIGPVLMADGSMTERIITLIIVLIIYALLTFTLILILKKIKK